MITFQARSKSAPDAHGRLWELSQSTKSRGRTDPRQQVGTRPFRLFGDAQRIYSSRRNADKRDNAAGSEERLMRFVIALDVAMRLLRERATIPPRNSLVAPTLLRSQILSELYASVRRGDFDRREAGDQLDHMRALKIRLLGDRVLQRVAWDIADELGWQDTLQAEYVGLTKLQADAFVTLDRSLARSLEGVVPLATFEDMFE